MELEDMKYALAKQIDTIESVNTNYGQIELDEEMKKAVKIALERILEKKIAEMIE